MSKSTPLSVQNAFNDKLKSSQDQATAIKAAHAKARQAIMEGLPQVGRRQEG